MKGIVVTTDNQVFTQEFKEPAYRSIGKIVGGYIEVVRPVFLPSPYVMIVNEEGLLKGLPRNEFGCFLYGSVYHKSPIVGDIVIMKEGFVDGEIDFVDMDLYEIGKVISEFRSCCGYLKPKEGDGKNV